MKGMTYFDRAVARLACLILPAILAGFSGAAEAQSIEPTGAIQSIAVNPHQPAHVLVAGHERIYRSTDGGRTWADSADAVQAWSLDIAHSDLEGDPDTSSIAFAGTRADGVAHSIDGGQTWIANLDFTGEVTRVAVRRSDGSLWAGSEQTLRVSNDAGANWQNVTNGLPEAHVHGIGFDPDNTNIVYVAKWNLGVFSTQDGGQSWAASNSGLTDTQVSDLDIDPRNSSVLYASTTAGIFQSVDAGTNWSVLSGPTLINELAISRINSSYLYVATENSGIHRSRDGGLTWEAATPNGVTAFTSIATAVDGTEHVYAGSVNDGLFVSPNSGVTWMSASEFAGTSPTPVTPPPVIDPGYANLSIEVADLQNGESVPAGGVARYRITIRNEGPDVATDVAFDAFWVQLHTFGSNDAMPFTISAPLGSCSTKWDCFFGDLPAGAIRTIEFSGNTEANSVTRYRLYARAHAVNAGPIEQTAEISASVTLVSTGGGGTGLLMLIALALLSARQRLSWCATK